MCRIIPHSFQQGVQTFVPWWSFQRGIPILLNYYTKYSNVHNSCERIKWHVFCRTCCQQIFIKAYMGLVTVRTEDTIYWSNEPWGWSITSVPYDKCIRGLNYPDWHILSNSIFHSVHKWMDCCDNKKHTLSSQYWHTIRLCYWNAICRSI